MHDLITWIYEDGSVQLEGGATALIMAARAEVLLKLNRPMT